MFWQGSLLWSRVAGICMAARGMVFACKGEPAPIAPSKPEPKPSDPNHEHEDLETMSMLSMMRDNGNGWVVAFHISFHSRHFEVLHFCPHFGTHPHKKTVYAPSPFALAPIQE